MPSYIVESYAAGSVVAVSATARGEWRTTTKSDG
jgi:hypothetical protein